MLANFAAPEVKKKESTCFR